ncbi:uncharacterized protein FIBRA_05039 [Fibroporia radiculosa]|uniref:Uncharacterized protein n=1 Tax=Fibroporia radiculosa TaxID=599839 RepID=J4GQA5_9APHY|nr:uncharacterized protein FIBRA_05039 [Fibroporia radiculosa]CCM02925.1 predicted protein [Fibroporia radiculosa]
MYQRWAAIPSPKHLPPFIRPAAPLSPSSLLPPTCSPALSLPSSLPACSPSPSPLRVAPLPPPFPSPPPTLIPASSPAYRWQPPPTAAPVCPCILSYYSSSGHRTDWLRYHYIPSAWISPASAPPPASSPPRAAVFRPIVPRKRKRLLRPSGPPNAPPVRLFLHPLSSYTNPHDSTSKRDFFSIHYSHRRNGRNNWNKPVVFRSFYEEHYDVEQRACG